MKEFDGKQVCAPCFGEHEFCSTCTADKCLTCEENIATMNYQKKCKQCTEPWIRNERSNPHCFCPYIVNVNDNYSCKKCEELIPGCNKCEYTTKLRHFADHQHSAVKVGWDGLLSAQNMLYMKTDYNLKPEWIICTEADNKTMVNMDI